jgi:hypothetical protein
MHFRERETVWEPTVVSVSSRLVAFQHDLFSKTIFGVEVKWGL